MRTTISIDEDMINDLMKLEGVRSRSEAIRRAVEDYLRRKRIEEFKKLAGSRLIDLTWEETEEIELQDLHRNAK